MSPRVVLDWLFPARAEHRTAERQALAGRERALDQAWQATCRTRLLAEAARRGEQVLEAWGGEQPGVLVLREYGPTFHVTLRAFLDASGPREVANAECLLRPGSACGLLQEVRVRTGQTGRGHATRVLGRALTLARQRGARRMEAKLPAEDTPDRARYLHLLERRGFQLAPVAAGAHRARAEL